MKIISYDRNMADGGAYNDSQSMLKANPELEIQSFSGGGNFSQIEELEREFEMEGGAKGIVDGFEGMPDAVELSNLMFALGLATKSTFGKNKINEAQADLFLNKFENIEIDDIIKLDLKPYRASLPSGPNTTQALFYNQARTQAAAAEAAAAEAAAPALEEEAVGWVGSHGLLGTGPPPQVIEAQRQAAAAAAAGQPEHQLQEIRVDHGGGYRGGAIDIDMLKIFIPKINTILKGLSLNYANFLFLYDTNAGILPGEHIPKFIKAFKEYLEAAVQAGKLPDWNTASKDATKVEPLFENDKNKKYAKAYQADLNKLSKTDPIMQSLAVYLKNKAAQYLPIVEQNARALEAFIQATPSGQFAGTLSNIFTEADFQLLNDYGYEVGNDTPHPKINFESVPSLTNVNTPMITFNEYNRYIGIIQNSQSTSQQINAAIDACLAIIREYIGKLRGIVIPKLREVANTGVFHAMSSKMKNTMGAIESSAIFEGRATNLAKLGKNSLATAVAVPGEVREMIQKQRESAAAATENSAKKARIALEKGLGPVSQSLVSAAAATRDAAGRFGKGMLQGAADVAAAAAEQPLLAAGPGGMVGMGGGGSRRTIRSRR